MATASGGRPGDAARDGSGSTAGSGRGDGAAGAPDSARRAAAAAARGAAGPGRDGPARRSPAAGSHPPGPAVPRLAPTRAQRALAPLAWGLWALVLTLVLPLPATTVLLVVAAVAAAAWLLEGRSAVLLRESEVVVQRPVGRVVVPWSEVIGVERRRPALTERAELVRGDGRRVALPAPQHGPLAALRDPAFDERLVLLRYRAAKARGGAAP